MLLFQTTQRQSRPLVAGETSGESSVVPVLTGLRDYGVSSHEKSSNTLEVSSIGGYPASSARPLRHCLSPIEEHVMIRHQKVVRESNSADGFGGGPVLEVLACTHLRCPQRLADPGTGSRFEISPSSSPAHRLPPSPSGLAVPGCGLEPLHHTPVAFEACLGRHWAQTPFRPDLHTRKDSPCRA